MKQQEREIEDVNNLTVQEIEKKIIEYTKEEKKTQKENVNEEKVEKRGNKGQSGKLDGKLAEMEALNYNDASV